MQGLKHLCEKMAPVFLIRVGHALWMLQRPPSHFQLPRNGQGATEVLFDGALAELEDVKLVHQAQADLWGKTPDIAVQPESP